MMRLKPQIDFALNLICFSLIVLMLGILSTVIWQVAIMGWGIPLIGIILIASIYVISVVAVIGCVKDMKKLLVCLRDAGSAG